jgi:hypothetical protein
METITGYKEVYIYSSFLMVSHNCMRTLMASLKAVEDKLNQELEESHGNYEIMKVVFGKRIDLFNRFLK